MLRTACLLFLLVASNWVWASAAQDLAKLLEQIWDYELSQYPTYATSLGVHEYDHKLPDYSPSALAARNARYTQFMQKLEQIPTDELQRTEQINVVMQRYRLQNNLDEYRFNAHYIPITAEFGFHGSMARLPTVAKFRNEQDYRNYLQRLQQLPEYFSQQIDWMRKGIATGAVQPKASLVGFEQSIAAYYQTAVIDSVFYQPFTKIADTNIKPTTAAKLIAQAQTVIKNQVFKAYEDFYQFMVSEYLPVARDDIAITAIPNGLAYYQNRAKYFTTIDLDAQSIHQTGLDEVARIRAEMLAVMQQLEYNGSHAEFINFLRTDPQFYAQTPEQLIKHASFVAKQMDAKLPQLFYTLPRTPYGVAPVPDSIAPKYTTGRYVPPSRDDEPGYYWVNTYALDKRPLYAIPALTLHEAVPGHHLQISLAREMDELPPVRRYTYISAFGEGWGLYSEYLGKEVGIYEDPYDEFGRLSYEMWRACRLVVDTGMHLKGWSRQQAIDYMLENTALSEHNIRTEIDRYITWPAQALSYKIGELEIKRLRAKAEQTLGNDFDLRAFHDAILEYGSIPLSVLTENIEQFIAEAASNR